MSNSISIDSYHQSLAKLSSSLRQYLKLKNLGVRDLARLIMELQMKGEAPCGVSEHCISSYVHGRALPNRARLASLAAGLGVPEHALVDPRVCVEGGGGGRRTYHTSNESVRVKRSRRGLDFVRVQLDVELPAKAGVALAGKLNNALDIIRQQQMEEQIKNDAAYAASVAAWEAENRRGQPNDNPSHSDQ